MKTLLIYPAFPLSFWCFKKSLDLFNIKAPLPPLNSITVAALLPQDWEFKLVDGRVRQPTEEEWQWAELVVISGMIVQQKDYLDKIREAKRRGKPVAVGGPYPTSTPEPVKDAGADYLILDEGEITIPMFLEALKRGEKTGIYRSAEKPDVTTTPIPRYDLLELDNYSSMSVQFSRGCPFQCEFCDIIVLYGRKPRTKTPTQLIKELQCIYDLGWRGPLFMVDDNFIGNKRNVKLLLKELKVWQKEHDYPFAFITEASIDLAKDTELMDLMVDCNFYSVFVGIESPDEESLQVTKKFQNLRDPLLESIDTIITSGLQVMGGFIIGFDGEKSGVGDRIVRFAQEAGIHIAMFGILHGFPNTALRERLKREGRLLEGDMHGDGSVLMNYIPTRPIEEIAQEYTQGLWQLYEPKNYLERQFKFIMKINQNGCRHKHRSNIPFFTVLKVSLILTWKYGVILNTRYLFWSHFLTILSKYPNWAIGYIMGIAQLEHLLEYRHIVCDSIQQELKEYKHFYDIVPQKMIEKAQLAS